MGDFSFHNFDDGNLTFIKFINRLLLNVEVVLVIASLYLMLPLFISFWGFTLRAD